MLKGHTQITDLGLYSVPCELSNLTSGEACEQSGGIAIAYWAQYSDIDWAAMVADTAKWDAATLTVKGYTMISGKVFKKIEFERKTPQYSFTYTNEQQFYAQVINMVLEGQSISQSTAIRKAIGCCNLVLHIIDNNGRHRVVGVEYTGSVFVKQLTGLRIGRHLDTSGQLSQTKSRDELDLTGESMRAPLYAATNIVIPV